MLKNHNLFGVLAGLVAALGWATTGVWIQNIALDYFTITMLRFLISGGIFLFLILIAYFFGKKIVIQEKSFFWAGGLGILLFFSILFVIFTYKNLSIGQATVLTNLHLFFIILFSLPTLFRKRRILHFLFGSIFLIFGIHIIFQANYSVQIWGILAGISSSLLFACFSFLSEKFLEKDSNKYLGVMLISGAFFGILISDGIPAQTINHASLLNLLILCIFSTLIAHYSYLYSIKTIGSLGASILSYFTILFGVLIEGILNGSFLFQQILGSIVVFFALLFLMLTYNKLRNAST